LGINKESKQFRLAHLFTYVLAGLVYIRRALLVKWAILTIKRARIKDLKERFT
jgi:hypothetical protein